MRKIKFRVWDNENCEWVKWHKVNGTIFVNGEDSIHERHPQNKHLILCQYTGLKDKNGKEIWESDYIKGKGAGFSTTHSRVHFTHDGAEINIGDDHWIQLSKFNEIEIIGNIYENPESLLKVIDTTSFQPPKIGKKKEKWIFRCNCCDYSAIFILYEGEGMSTGCEECPGDMERVTQSSKLFDEK